MEDKMKDALRHIVEMAYIHAWWGDDARWRDEFTKCFKVVKPLTNDFQYDGKSFVWDGKVEARSNHEHSWYIAGDLPTANGLQYMERYTKAAYIKRKRQDACLQAQSWLNILARRKVQVKTPVTVLLTRIGRKVDKEENLPGAFKAVKDGIADAFCGHWKCLNAKGYGDDSDPRLIWQYAQRPKAKGDTFSGEVKISFEA